MTPGAYGTTHECKGPTQASVDEWHCGQACTNTQSTTEHHSTYTKMESRQE